MWDIYMLVRYVHMTMIQIDKLTFSSDASPYLQTTTPAEFKTTTLQRSAINMSIGKNLNYIYLYWIQIWALILVFSAFIIPRCMPKLKAFNINYKKSSRLFRVCTYMKHGTKYILPNKKNQCVGASNSL